MKQQIKCAIYCRVARDYGAEVSSKKWKVPYAESEDDKELREMLQKLKSLRKRYEFHI